MKLKIQGTINEKTSFELTTTHASMVATTLLQRNEEEREDIILEILDKDQSIQIYLHGIRVEPNGHFICIYSFDAETPSSSLFGPRVIHKGLNSIYVPKEFKKTA